MWLIKYGRQAGFRLERLLRVTFPVLSTVNAGPLSEVKLKREAEKAGRRLRGCADLGG